jgi:uncharacterized membrane protein YagU involved in acid resistance
MKRWHMGGVMAGGLIGGLMDLAFAISWAAYNGTAPVQLLQIIASGAFGKAALSGGTPMAAFGLAAHFGISLAWACVYLVFVRAKPQFLRHAFTSGIWFGIFVFFAMRLVVLPVSAFPFPIHFKPVATIADLLSHMFLFGVPIAWAARRSNFGLPVAD